MKIAIFGSGSWATALVKIACETHKEIFWWVREEEIAEGVRKHGYNPLYLSQCELDSCKIHIETDIKNIINKTDNLLFVVPSAFLARSLEGLSPKDFEDKYLISAIKGIVPETNQIVADYFAEHFLVPYNNQAVISGPSHAEEIAKSSLTYLTVGSTNTELAEFYAESFSCRYVNTVVSNDIIGIEYGGILKNIYALAVGIANGLGRRDNFISVLVANSAQEMQRFLDKVSPLEGRNITHFVYLGDLLVTAYSQHSRNRTFGQMVGSGYSIHSAQLEMKMVAEGYYAAKSIHIANKAHNADIPIAEAVYRILYKGSSPTKEIEALSQDFR